MGKIRSKNVEEHHKERFRDILSDALDEIDNGPDSDVSTCSLAQSLNTLILI